MNKKKSNNFLLLGPEEGEKAQFIENYIKQIRESTGGEPEISRFYSFDSKIIDIVALLRNGSLFHDYKVVIINNIEEIKFSSDINLLTEYFENPVDNTSLIMLSNTINKVDKNISAKIPPSNKKIFWELFENQKRGWISQFFRQKSIEIDKSGINYILEMVENNTIILRKECSNLANFFGTGTQISLKDIEKYIYHSKEENVFTLFEKISHRDLQSSLEVLQKILLSGEITSTGILNGLLWQVRKLLSLKKLMNNNYHTDEIFKTVGLGSKRNQQIYLQAHKNYTKPEIVSLIVLFSDFEIFFRTLKTDLHFLLLQLLLYYIITGRRKNNYTFIRKI